MNINQQSQRSVVIEKVSVRKENGQEINASVPVKPNLEHNSLDVAECDPYGDRLTLEGGRNALKAALLAMGFDPALELTKIANDQNAPQKLRLKVKRALVRKFGAKYIMHKQVT